MVEALSIVLIIRRLMLIVVNDIHRLQGVPRILEHFCQCRNLVSFIARVVVELGKRLTVIVDGGCVERGLRAW
jgi:hypothetical protein